MGEIVNVLNEKNSILFILLFARMGGLTAFFPFFSHGTIPISVKTALTFFLCVIFFDQARVTSYDLNVYSIALMMMFEFALGFLSALLLQVAFAALMLAGEQISFVMGFTMASVLDPGSGVNSPIIAQFLTLLGLLFLLYFDFHHGLILFISSTVGEIALGGYYPNIELLGVFTKAIVQMFVFGFALAFPIIALSLLSDIIFGMLMKTMPQFNLLVVGYPIKIFLSMAVLCAVLAPMMILFKKDFFSILENIFKLF